MPATTNGSRSVPLPSPPLTIHEAAELAALDHPEPAQPPAPVPTVVTPPVLLTTAEVAQLLRVDVETVRRYVKAGELPAYRVGRTLRVETHALDRFLQGRRR